MSRNDDFFYNYTNYPKIYKETGWGSLKYSVWKMYENIEEIFENRNKFIIEYNISKITSKTTSKHSITKLSKYINTILDKVNGGDHIEIYELKEPKCYIILMSLYGKYSNAIFPGWEKVYNLYCSYAASFIHKFSV